MIVSHKHKFIFVHVPKTGGSSVTAALAPYINDDKKKPKEYPKEGEVARKGWQIPFHVKNMHERLSDNNHGILDQGYFLFGFVRNPWEWVWSHYRFQGIPKKVTINQYLMENLKHGSRTYHGNILWPQTSWFTDGMGKMRASFIGKFENIEEDFAKAMKFIRLEGVELPHMNNAETYDSNYKKMDYRKYYDDESREIIAHAHKKDIEAFGYTF